jgi:MFS family permease
MTTERRAVIAPVILLGYLVLPMAMSGASVAVPSVSADLEVHGGAASWIVTGYFLAASSLMLVIGAVADSAGRRRIYRAGALVYAAGSAAAAVAPSIGLLIGARVVSGIGAAAIMACGAATAAAVFTGPARTRMFAGIGTAAAVGLAAGPAVSGVLVEGFGWRVAFAGFAAAGAVLVAGSLALPESRARETTGIDWAGAVLIVSGLGALMFTIAGGPARGWTAPASLVGAATVLACLIALCIVEPRANPALLDRGLLGNRQFLGWLLSVAIVSVGYGGLLAHFPSFLHGVTRLSPSESGLMMLTPIVPMIAMPVLVGQVSTRIPARLMIAPALALIAIGNVWLGLVVTPTASVSTYVPPLLVIGVGLGAATGVVDAQAMNQVEADRHGLAAGMINTVRGAATTIVMAALGSALVALIAAEVGDSALAGRAATGNLPSGDAGLREAVSAAWRTAQLGLGLVCAVSAVVVVALLARGQTALQQPPERARAARQRDPV